MQPVEHLLFFDWEIGDYAMQEERGFIEQAFRRLDVLHHDAPCQSMQLRVFFRREFSSSEYNHGQIAERRILAEALQNFEARHIREAQIENRAIEGLRSDGGQ